MEFRILGPLEVIGPDGPLLLRGAKRRGLLAFLLVQRGQVISSDRLVEALGDGEAGSGALGTIQTYLSQLRKILPQVGGELVTQPSGYVFDVPDDARRRGPLRGHGARGERRSPTPVGGCGCSTARSDSGAAPRSKSSRGRGRSPNGRDSNAAASTRCRCARRRASSAVSTSKR